MNWLVDSQLPFKLAMWLRSEGYDAIHASDLPGGNFTPDQTICGASDIEDRILISKDSDFVLSRQVSGSPRRLLLISTGNITNRDLLSLFANNFPQLSGAFENAAIIELNRDGIVVYDGQE